MSYTNWLIFMWALAMTALILAMAMFPKITRAYGKGMDEGLARQGIVKVGVLTTASGKRVSIYKEDN